VARSPRLSTAAAANAVLPTWVKPQLTRLAAEAPSGDEWVHELKFDGYRMHARLDRGDVRLLARTGLDWTGKYPAIAAAPHTLPAPLAYLDAELCGVRPDGVTSFALIQNAAERRGGANLVYFVFDLLYLDDLNLMPLPLADRKARLATLLERRDDAIRYSEPNSARVRHSTGMPARSGSRASSRSGWMPHTSQAIAVSGSKPNVSTGRNSSSSAGPTPKQPTIHRRIAARVLRSRREADLRWPDRYWDAGPSARRPVETAAATAGRQDAARYRSAALNPLRLAACAFSGSLGSAGARR
jgi:ATP dependent DNA ligase domain